MEKPKQGNDAQSAAEVAYSEMFQQFSKLSIDLSTPKTNSSPDEEVTHHHLAHVLSMLEGLKFGDLQVERLVSILDLLRAASSQFLKDNLAHQEHQYKTIVDLKERLEVACDLVRRQFDFFG